MPEPRVRGGRHKAAAADKHRGQCRACRLLRPRQALAQAPALGPVSRPSRLHTRTAVSELRALLSPGWDATSGGAAELREDCWSLTAG